MKEEDWKYTLPEGAEREVLVWMEFPSFGRPWNSSGCYRAWWRHGPSCFSWNNIEDINHLVLAWMELPDKPMEVMKY